ncbi:conserved hypothetical protein [Desulforamulus hydrothermalis Lam5 = DSM 18033]|uniref:Uncharacterized protein n=1 Tax=Desulforamulus hydrothermalis Lam5 = DSM 18033 TaxID=1121428 RepID=K8DZ31_9FIRM|nr:conserved hypothetical protein [Desulforamulus hydrothermalis Lam5 = DSM 18033]SHH37105.1 hypothetical protein SAMN02745177_02325 [Desulforamulus hydrothermalis Lam5 = DSM 18033]
MATLCEICAKATPMLCPWIDKGDRTGLEYKVKSVPAPFNSTRKYEIVTVLGCERFKRGPLPPLGRR